MAQVIDLAKTVEKFRDEKIEFAIGKAFKAFALGLTLGLIGGFSIARTFSGILW